MESYNFYGIDSGENLKPKADRIQPAPGNRETARSDARKIASYLRTTYGTEVYGIGSLFRDDKQFKEKSDIDLVAKGLPLESLYSYLRFRHLFRNNYGYELRHELMQPLVPALHVSTRSPCVTPLNHGVVLFGAGAESTVDETYREKNRKERGPHHFPDM